MNEIHFEIALQNLILSPLKVAYWTEQKALLLADLHLGKSGHFRKHGIGIPVEIIHADLDRLSQAIKKYQPEKLLIIGDFCHSRANSELEYFTEWRDLNPGLEIILVRGNHDILSDSLYSKWNIKVFDGIYETEGLTFSHDPINWAKHFNYVLSGHLHPGVKITGAGRQKITLPCFAFGKNQGVLPAFSIFTGLHPIKKEKTGQYFAISTDTVIQLL